MFVSADGRMKRRGRWSGLWGLELHAGKKHVAQTRGLHVYIDDLPYAGKQKYPQRLWLEEGGSEK
jgi:hypothetical protein